MSNTDVLKSQQAFKPIKQIARRFEKSPQGENSKLKKALKHLAVSLVSELYCTNTYFKYQECGFYYRIIFFAFKKEWKKIKKILRGFVATKKQRGWV